jgi:proton glutamate symport protein
MLAPVIAVGLGVLCGLAHNRWGTPVGDGAVAFLDPLGGVWLSALQMLVLPLTVAVLTVAIGRAGPSGPGRIGWTTLGWFIGMLAVTALITVAVTPLLLTTVPVGGMQGPATAVATEAAGVAATGTMPTLRDWLVNLVPSNLVRAAADGDLFAVMVATMLFGAALRLLPAAHREPIVVIAESISAWCLALARLLLRVLPVAVFALTFSATVQSGSASIGGLVRYVVLLSALLAAATLLLYPVTIWLARIPLRSFASGIWPAQVLAFSSRSSVACLPIMLERAHGALGLPPRTADVTLPFAVASFKLNMGISANFQMLFLLHVFDIDAPPGALALAVLAVTLQSFATPGLPSGAIWTTTPVYLALGIPLEGIVLTNVVDTIPDLFKTVTNVTGDLSIATIVGRRDTATPSA